MSYIINYFHPIVETNIEEMPEIPLKNFKINGMSLDKIAYLVNVPISSKAAKKMLTHKTLFSKFNMRTFAERYMQRNQINPSDDLYKKNIQTIVETLFPQGKKIILNNINHIILKTEWDQVRKLQKNIRPDDTEKVYDITLRITFKQKEDFTAADKRELNCDERLVKIRADIRDIFHKKTPTPEIPIAKPVTGGKKRIRTRRTIKSISGSKKRKTRRRSRFVNCITIT